MKFPAPRSWFFLSVRRGFSTSRDLLLPVAFATLIISAIASPVIALSEFVRSQESGETALTQIEVTPGGEVYSNASQLTERDIESIEDVPGVVDVLPDVTVGVYAADGSTWALSLRPLNPAVLPPDVSEATAEGLSSDEVIVPAAVEDSKLEDDVGSNVEISYTKMTGQNTGELAQRNVRFIAAYDPSWQGYGPGVALASPELVVELLAAKSGLSGSDFMRTVGVEAVTVTVGATKDVDEVTAQLRDQGLTAIPVGDTLGQLPGVFAIFPQVLLVVGIGSGALLLLQLSRVTRASLARRTNEFALLRLRAWSAHDVTRLIVLDVSAGSLVGAFVGMLLGAGIGSVLVMAWLPEIEGISFVSVAEVMPLLSLGIAVFCAVVSLFASRHTLRTDPFITVMSRRR